MLCSASRLPRAPPVSASSAFHSLPNHPQGCRLTSGNSPPEIVYDASLVVFLSRGLDNNSQNLLWRVAPHELLEIRICATGWHLHAAGHCLPCARRGNHLDCLLCFECQCPDCGLRIRARCPRRGCPMGSDRIVRDVCGSGALPQLLLSSRSEE